MDASRGDETAILDAGLVELGELLRKLRRAREPAEIAACADAMAERLCRLAHDQNCSVSCPDLLLHVTLLGKAMVQEGRLAAWAHVVGRITRIAIERHDLAASHMGFDLLQRLSSAETLDRILQRFAEPDPPPVSALAEYLAVLPATALAAVARVCVATPCAAAKPVLLDFVRRAARHHAYGVRELLEQPAAPLAALGLELLPECEVDARLDLAITALRHPAVAIRCGAARRLGDQESEPASAALLTRLTQRGARREPEEEVALLGALARTQRTELLAHVEERLLASHPSFTERLVGALHGGPRDPVIAALIQELARIDSPQARDLLQRGTRADDPAVARACRAALRD